MIEGKLINLRAMELGDLERNQRWMNDREVTQYLNARYQISLAAEEAWMQSQMAARLTYEHPFFAIETKDGVHIGNISFHETSPEDRSGRLGIMIGDKTYWSKGYGTDAITTLVRFGFDEMNLHRVDLTVDADNARAIACYRKCGFVEEARMRDARYTRGAYGDQLVMAVLRGDVASGEEAR